MNSFSPCRPLCSLQKIGRKVLKALAASIFPPFPFRNRCSETQVEGGCLLGTGVRFVLFFFFWKKDFLSSSSLFRVLQKRGERIHFQNNLGKKSTVVQGKEDVSAEGGRNFLLQSTFDLWQFFPIRAGSKDKTNLLPKVNGFFTILVPLRKCQVQRLPSIETNF